MAVNCIPFVFPGIIGVRCAFQIRTDPDPFADTISLTGAPDRRRAAANRDELARLCGLEDLAELRQVHGVTTIFNPAPVASGSEPVQEGDGLATDRADVGLLIKTADCQPILLAHKSGRHIAALHAGWRGNRQDYPRLAVLEICDRYRLEPGDFHAVRGPSLGPSAAEFTGFASEWGDDYSPWFDADSRSMDLWRLTRDQLIRAGLAPDHIYGLDLCTWSLENAFFSYRRNRLCGRQGSVIWLTGECAEPSGRYK